MKPRAGDREASSDQLEGTLFQGRPVAAVLVDFLNRELVLGADLKMRDAVPPVRLFAHACPYPPGIPLSHSELGPKPSTKARREPLFALRAQAYRRTGMARPSTDSSRFFLDSFDSEGYPWGRYAHHERLIHGPIQGSRLLSMSWGHCAAFAPWTETG